MNQARKQVGSGLERYRVFIIIFAPKIGDPIRFGLANRWGDPRQILDENFSERDFPYRLLTTERLVHNVL